MARTSDVGGGCERPERAIQRVMKYGMDLGSEFI
jgi:hypothetical protein